MSKLKNKIILSLLIILLVMSIGPLFIIKFAEAHTSMGWFMILFFLINPTMSIGLGILAGTEIRKLWCIPLLVAVLFPLLYWIVLQEFVLDLFIYSIGYFIVGIVAMFITSLLNNRNK